MSVLYHFNFNNSETERFFDDLTLGLPYALNSVMGVEHIMSVVNEGATLAELDSWQNEMDYLLPSDLMSFYTLINGIHMTWGYKMRNSALLKVGLLKVESLQDLKPLGYFRETTDSNKLDLFTTLDLVSDDDTPKFNTNFKILQLEYTRDSSVVCLVYSVLKKTHTIWLLDRSYQWHFLADSFTKYFYLMVKHAGLPQWQMGKTALGMSMWAKQLMYTFALCLQSPPTSMLHRWVVDSNIARSSYEAALKDPNGFKFSMKKSFDYKGYFSDKKNIFYFEPDKSEERSENLISEVDEPSSQESTSDEIEGIKTDTLPAVFGDTERDEEVTEVTEDGENDEDESDKSEESSGDSSFATVTVEETDL